ncbi:mitochondrial distribution and morphology protein 34 [Auriculariales sp. MPI-PUGE-AT-0066]|nr:mitochondrial distribution and morphology protein 34 [Auriculariales sp. MPI-PUGE-AT-0066]
MSFQFEWPEFSDDFHRDARQLVENALNKGNKPPIIADRIEVVEIEMGSQPPELEIRDIGEITMDQFRGIFRLSYNGDAYLVLRTKVQANPLTHKKPDIHLMTGSRGFLAANQPLVVPMLLRLSHFKINCYVVLVISKQKGITLVFKTDPLQNVDVSSTFDSIAVLQQYIQREIEEQLREMFREDLPSIIHKLSQRWLTQKTKVKAPYLGKKEPNLETVSTPDLRNSPFMHRSHPILSRSSPSLAPSNSVSHAARISLPPSTYAPSIPPSLATSLQYRVPRAASVAATSALSTETEATPDTTPPNDDEEDDSYDPTYGMRPERVPNRSEFSSFKRLWQPNRGLANLAEEDPRSEALSDEHEGEGDGSVDAFDLVSWDDVATTPSEMHMQVHDTSEDYDAIPAVGGGVILRPRVVHAQSRQGDPPPLSAVASPLSMRSPMGRSLADVSHPGSSSLALRLAEVQAGNNPARQLFARSSTLPTLTPRYPQDLSQSLPTLPPPRPSRAGRRLSNDSSYFPHMPTPPPSEAVISDRDDDPFNTSQPHSPLFATQTRPRRSSQRHRSSSPLAGGSRAIVLQPGLNDSVTQLGHLSQLNQTLSPYTRSLEHVTVRSIPRSTLLPTPEKHSSPKSTKKADVQDREEVARCPSRG